MHKHFGAAHKPPNVHLELIRVNSTKCIDTELFRWASGTIIATNMVWFPPKMAAVEQFVG